MKKPERTKGTAIDAFVLRIAEIRELLEALTQANNDHFGADPENVTWGAAGDAAHIASELRDLVAFIRNEER